jgi:hypothetical protein
MEHNLIVDIIEYTDEHFPGWVKCTFCDISGKQHYFVEKIPVLTEEPISSISTFPKRGYIAGKIVGKEKGIVCFNTKIPYDIESVDGETEFFVSENMIKIDKNNNE